MEDITIVEAAKLVGVSTYSLIYLASNAHGKINMWSKYKPVKLNAIHAGEKDDNWWKGSDGTCGINIGLYRSLGSNESGMIKDMTDGITWTYSPPTGTRVDPYRLSDFIGYNPNAIFPLESTVTSIIYLTQGGNTSFWVEDAPMPDNNLRFSDISINGVNMGDMYLGVVLFKNSGSKMITATSDTTFGTEGSAGVHLSNLNSYAGVWQCGFYLCSEKIVQDGQLPSATYIPLALPVKQVTIYAAGAQIEVIAYGYWDGDSGFYYTYTIKNDSSSSQITGINIRLMRRTTEDYASGEVVKSLMVNQTKYVPIGYQYSYEDTYVSQTRDSKYEYYLQMSANNAATTYTPLEEGFEVE